MGPEHAGQPWADDPAEFCNWSRRPLPDENRRSDPPEAESWREPPELTPMPWAERSDVITVVEDLADQGVRVCQIVRELGLSRAEVITIMRRLPGPRRAASDG